MHQQSVDASAISACISNQWMHQQSVQLTQTGAPSTGCAKTRRGSKCAASRQSAGSPGKGTVDRLVWQSVSGKPRTSSAQLHNSDIRKLQIRVGIQTCVTTGARVQQLKHVFTRCLALLCDTVLLQVVFGGGNDPLLPPCVVAPVGVTFKHPS